MSRASSALWPPLSSQMCHSIGPVGSPAPFTQKKIFVMRKGRGGIVAVSQESAGSKRLAMP